MQIAEAVNSFFVAFPYYVETRIQVASLHVAAWKGNSDLCKNIIKNNAKNYFQKFVNIKLATLPFDRNCQIDRVDYKVLDFLVIKRKTP